MAQLQRIEAALGQVLARSDEQLAYYVAQAREIIDLSLLSQKQIVDDLQHLAGADAAAPSRPSHDGTDDTDDRRTRSARCGPCSAT
jgi:hypothetical protein